LAIPDFPLAYGNLWPAMDADAVAAYNARRIELTTANAITAAQIGLQMAHRLMALAILVCVGVLAWWAPGSSRSAALPWRRLTFFWLGLLLAQAALGAWTIWSQKAADVATAHVLVGALSLVTGVFGCLICFRRPAGNAMVMVASTSELAQPKARLSAIVNL
jgi:heme a synthase